MCCGGRVTVLVGDGPGAEDGRLRLRRADVDVRGRRYVGMRADVHRRAASDRTGQAATVTFERVHWDRH